MFAITDYGVYFQGLCQVAASATKHLPRSYEQLQNKIPKLSEPLAQQLNQNTMLGVAAIIVMIVGYVLRIPLLLVIGILLLVHSVRNMEWSLNMDRQIRITNQNEEQLNCLGKLIQNFQTRLTEFKGLSTGELQERELLSNQLQEKVDALQKAESELGIRVESLNEVHTGLKTSVDTLTDQVAKQGKHVGQLGNYVNQLTTN